MEKYTTWKLTWRPPSNRPDFDVLRAITDEALRVVSTQTPELADLFPFRCADHGMLHFGDGWLGIIIDYSFGPGIPSFAKLEDIDLQRLAACARRNQAPSHSELRAQLGEGYFSFNRFTYVGPWGDGMMSWDHLLSNLLAWINQVLRPEVTRRNQARIARAIPTPPKVDIGKVADALWVLECEKSIRQGTAFSLRGVGLVTCAHVLGPNTKAFRPLSPAQKLDVEVVSTHDTIDLAILRVARSGGDLVRESADDLKIMEHITVCGFPNYRIGDTGTYVPGMVVGFRTVSSIRRVLTNAPIISGVSGAPVMNAAGAVVGVAATGADRMEAASDTEHHSVIPIDALNILPRS